MIRQRKPGIVLTFFLVACPSMRGSASPIPMKLIPPETLLIEPDLYWMKSVSANRFFMVGKRRKTEANGQSSLQERILDLQEGTVRDIDVPMTGFHAKYDAILGNNTSLAETIHFDGNVASLMVHELGPQYQRKATYLFQYKQQTGGFSDLVKLGDHSSHRYIHPLGIDRADAHFYFAYAVNDKNDVVTNGPLSYELSRVDLKKPSVDWQMTLNLPLRAKQLAIKSVAFSPDGAKIALAEYDDRAYERTAHANPPPKCMSSTSGTTPLKPTRFR